MNGIDLLDCTLRDGCYVVDAKFGAPSIKGIIGKLEEAGIEIIECGWLKDKPYVEGTAFYHLPSDMEQYLNGKKANALYTVMIDWDRYQLDNLPVCDGKSVDAIRVVFPHGKHSEGIEVGKMIQKKGYKVFFQAANTLAYSDSDLISLADEINAAEPVSLSVVDTFGAMYEEDLERIVKILAKRLKPQIKLGFHSHNNQQLSFALTIHFIKMMNETKRGIIVDTSLCGMGRGAGNTTTELVVSYLNRKCGGHYNMDAVMDAIDIYMGYFSEKYQWGYSTPYFIAGMYCCHVNNIAYLLNSHRTNAKDMRNIIESLSDEDRKKYDYDLLEQKYMDNQSHYVDDAAAVEKLKAEIGDRGVLLIAPGKSSVSEREAIEKYICDNNPVVIGVNAILPGYKYDYVMFVNSARYEYARDAYGDLFSAFKHILLSNIKCRADEGNLIISFESVIKRGWKYFDNAVICCLRLMDRIGVDRVSISGFDGFKQKYNESYADPFLPTLNPDNDWDALNAEINDIFKDFLRNARRCKHVNFITPSIFND